MASETLCGAAQFLRRGVADQQAGAQQFCRDAQAAGRRGKMYAQTREGVARDLQPGAEAVVRDVRLDADLLAAYAVERSVRVLLGGIEQGLHALAVAAAVGRIRGGEVQVEAQPVLRAPGVRGQRVEAAVEIVEGRLEGGGFARAQPGAQVEGGERDAFVGVVDGAAREVEVAGDLEDPAVERARVEVLAQQAADAQMELLARVVREQRVGRLLHAVVREAIARAPETVALGAVAVVERHHEALAERRHEVVRELARAPLGDDGQGLEVEGAAYAGRQRQHRARAFGQAAQALDHELDHVGAERARADRRFVPFPALAVEADQAFLVHRVEELVEEERIALRLLVAGFGQARAFDRAAAQGVGEQLADLREVERLQAQFHRRQRAPAQVLDEPGERMARPDLVVPVAADEQQARAFMDSPGYRDIAKDRIAGADTVARTISGVRRRVIHGCRQIIGADALRAKCEDDGCD